MIKTTQEILAYIPLSDDFFGHANEVLCPYLSAEEVKPFCEQDADLSDWKQQPLERDTIVAEMAEYMTFAWEKAQDHRGLSAMRSVTKMQAWLWLLGDDETLAYAKNYDNYAQYGAPVLKKICEVYSFPIPDGEEIENMAKGLPCTSGCVMGCGVSLMQG